MTTINTILARVDALVPNAYEAEQKAAWVVELDGQLANDCARLTAADRAPFRYPDDGDIMLFAQPPYDKVYDLYVFAMMDFFNREIAAYNNSAALYTEAMRKFQAWYIRTHRPPHGGNFIYGE